MAKALDNNASQPRQSQKPFKANGGIIRIPLLFALIGLLAFTSRSLSGADDPEELSNASIVEMKQLGLGDALIIDKIKVTKSNFDLTINGLRNLKKANIAESVISAMLATSKPLQQSPDASNTRAALSPPNENRLTPKFYGLFAIMENELMEIKSGDNPTIVPPTVQFIYYSKSVADAESFGLFEIPSASRPVQTIRDGKFKGWDDFMKQSQEHSEEIRGLLEGLPRGSVQIELRGTSVPGQPEMMTLAPAAPLTPGSYQIGIRQGKWYQLKVSNYRSPQASSGMAEPAKPTRFGPPLKPLTASISSEKEPKLHVPREVMENPAYPIILKAIKAHGGVDSILRAATSRSRATGRTWVEGQGFVNINVFFYWKQPEQMRQHLVLFLKGGPLDQIFTFNKGDVRGLSGNKSYIPSKSIQDSLRNELFMQNIESLTPLLEGKYVMTLNPPTVIEGRSYFTILTSNPSNNATLLFDPDTYCLARRRFSKLDQSGKRIISEVKYSDYKSIEGVMRPTTVKGYENGNLKQELQVHELTPLEDIAEIYFTDPGISAP